MALAAFTFASCSVDSSEPAKDPITKEDPETPDTPAVPEAPSAEPKTVSATETVTAKTVWTFSDLGSVAIEGVKADTAFTTASALASASTTYTTFSAAAKVKYSLKNDVSYPSKDKKLTAKIKSLGASGVPIQYNQYEANASCSLQDASDGGLQIQDEAFTVGGVQGPFKLTVLYSANSNKAKTDGRYVYAKIDGTKYDDEVVKTARSLDSKGVSFTVEYTGTDAVDIAIGATGATPCFVRLYDVIISKEVEQTTTTTTTTNEDGSVTTVVTVTDEDGNVVSQETSTTTPSSPSSEPTVDDPTATEEYTNGTKIGARTKLNEVNTANIKNAIRVSTPAEFEAAITQVQAGGAIVLAEGTYAFDHQVNIKYGNNGSANAMKYIVPATGAKVTLDFSSQSYDSNDTSKNARGLQMEGNYWHVYGLTVYGSADNGIFVAGKHNIVEHCILQANRDTGLQISRRSSSVENFDDWPSDNLILNCTSFDNHDPATDENADGFASKLTCGNGNVFNGCIAYCNSDDGWDLYAKSATGSIGVVTLKNCVSFGNGKLTTGSAFANGDMNGFKLGGSNNAVPTPHVVYNCMAFLNGKDGFTDNGNGGALQITACTSYANVNSNFNFYRTFAGGVFRKLVSMIGSEKPKQVDKFGGKEKEVTVAAKIADTVYYGDKSKGTFYYVTEESAIYNGEKIGTAVTDPYKSDVNVASAPTADGTVDAKCRNADGTVNMGGYLETKSSSTYSALGARFGSEAYEVLDVSLILN